MSIHLHPCMLASAYELLHETEPFARWRIPDAEDVTFLITRSRDVRGTWAHQNDRHVITISETNVGRLDNLVRTMAHEMVHAYIHELKIREGDHGPAFRKLAHLVCKHHGFDPKEF